MMEKNRVHRLEVRLSDSEEKRLLDACKITDSSRSSVAREALWQHTRWLIKEFGHTIKQNGSD